jgi:taurine dioxygenase
MKLETRPLHPEFGVEVLGLRIGDGLDDATFAALRDQFERNSLVLLRDQSLSPPEQERFTRRFRELEYHVLKEHTFADYPGVMILTNAVEGGKPLGAHKIGWHWHTDLTYYPKPCDMTMLLGVEIPPEGGDTLFCSLTAAYDALPAAERARYDRMTAVHSYNYMRSIKYPDAAPLSQEQLDRVRDVEHPLIRQHPATGRRALYVSEYIIRNFVGMDVPESQALLARLVAHATEDRFVYRHRWRPGDLVFWDNRATMHKATPYDDAAYTRRMHRSMTAGDVPFIRLQ